MADQSKKRKTRASSKAGSDLKSSSDKNKTEASSSSSAPVPKDYPQQLAYSVLWTDDIKKSAEFWKETFGFSYVSSEEFPQWIEMIPPQKDGTKIGLHATGKESPHVQGAMELGISVPDLEAFHHRVTKDKKLTVVTAPKKTEWGGQMAEYKSPEGVGFSVIQQDSHQPSSDHKKTDANVTSSQETNGKTETPATKGNAVCHVEIPCGDLQRAQKFYGDVFGWTFNQYGDYVIWKANDKEYNVGGGLTKADSRLPAPWLHLYVSSIEDALEKVKANGGEVLKEKFALEGGHGFNAYFKDTEGNQMAVYSLPIPK